MFCISDSIVIVCLFVKLRSGERIKCLPLVCILFTAVVWGFALYFFFQGLSTWQVSNPLKGAIAVCSSTKYLPVRCGMSLLCVSLC